MKRMFAPRVLWVRVEMRMSPADRRACCAAALCRAASRLAWLFGFCGYSQMACSCSRLGCSGPAAAVGVVDRCECCRSSSVFLTKIGNKRRVYPPIKIQHACLPPRQASAIPKIKQRRRDNTTPAAVERHGGGENLERPTPRAPSLRVTQSASRRSIVLLDNFVCRPGRRMPDITQP